MRNASIRRKRLLSGDKRPLYKCQTLVFIVLGCLLSILAVFSIHLAKQQEQSASLLLVSNNHAPVKHSPSRKTNLLQHQHLPSAPKRHLPSLRNGGIVIFFHNPKTGGTTLRGMMKKNPMIDFVSRQDLSSIQELDSIMNTWTSNNNNSKIHFMEIHGHPPGFLELLPKLQQWKQQASQHNIRMFTFTMMRDPLDWLLSCFNFFCMDIRKHTNCTAPPTIEGLLLETKSNPQSRWYCFANTIMAVSNAPLVDMTSCSLDILAPPMMQYMDWVGFMEHYQETVVVLQHVLFKNVTRYFRKRNQTQRLVIHREMLNASMTNKLQLQYLKQDYKLYQALQQEYQLDNMLLPHTNEPAQDVDMS